LLPKHKKENEEGKSAHYKLNYNNLFEDAVTFSHLTIIRPDLFPFRSIKFF